MATVLSNAELLIQKLEEVNENYAIVTKGPRTTVSSFNQVVKIKANIWHLNHNLPSASCIPQPGCFLTVHNSACP